MDKPIGHMNLAEVTLEILRTAVNIPDGLYARAQYLAKVELQVYDKNGMLSAVKEEAQ